MAFELNTVKPDMALEHMISCPFYNIVLQYVLNYLIGGILMSEENNAVNKKENYGEFTRDLVHGIFDGISRVTDEQPKKYSKFDLYNSLALSISIMEHQRIPSDIREEIIGQGDLIANAMIEAALDSTEDVYLPSILIGANRAMLLLSGIVESEEEDLKNNRDIE